MDNIRLTYECSWWLCHKAFPISIMSIWWNVTKWYDIFFIVCQYGSTHSFSDNYLVMMVTCWYNNKSWCQAVSTKVKNGLATQTKTLIFQHPNKSKIFLTRLQSLRLTWVVHQNMPARASNMQIWTADSGKQNNNAKGKNHKYQ